jgi:ribonuclease HI
MVSTWHVWSDGSCQHGLREVAKGQRGWGGWAAIVEHGSDGSVRRGRVGATTNVRMELMAAIEGLRMVPNSSSCTLHTDSTAIVVVHVRHLWPGFARYSGRDAALWRALAVQFERLDVKIDLLGKGKRHPLHRRAHVIAGVEARAGLRNLPIDAIPLDDGHRLRRGMQRSAVRAWRDDHARARPC